MTTPGEEQIGFVRLTKRTISVVAMKRPQQDGTPGGFVLVRSTLDDTGMAVAVNIPRSALRDVIALLQSAASELTS